MTVAVCACGGSKSSTTPSDPTQNGCFAIVGNKGSISATIDGLPAFAGTVPTGQAIYTAGSSGVVASFTLQATDVKDGTSVLVAGPVKLGATTAAINDLNGGTVVQILLTTRSCTAGTGSWSASAVNGTATVTLTTATSSSVAGTFTGTVTPGAGSGATGNKAVSGSFTATF
jgi:hypothetical protein